MEVAFNKKTCLFNEINFDILPSQSNIYGISCFKNPEQLANKVLISLIEGRIFACEYYNHDHEDLKYVSREVAFTYIPGKCHIISIDSFSCEARGLVVGITFCKESSENFLNIYCNYGDGVPDGQERDLDNVAQYCQSFELPFTPYQLTHWKVKNLLNGQYNTVFILLGGDGFFHIYAQGESAGEFACKPASDYFVELADRHGIPMYLDIIDVNETKRVTAVGYTFGKINVFLVNSEENELVSSWEIDHDSPISQCLLFKDFDTVNVVVVSSRELTVVYENVLKNGLSQQLILETSEDYDCATSCAISDINFDGHKEIIIGTYGCKLLAYSYDSSKSLQSLEPMWTRQFAAPILKIKLVDLIGDGLDELVVLSLNGVHVLQSNLLMLLNKCKSHLMIQ